ncbi:MAG: hypothetical protein KGJ84_09820 [Elusimicrobia bacterium]|nr:hypothetical protein [Elusimicrobiota bacterium]
MFGPILNDESYGSLLATQDEMTFPDWRKRLARAKREAAAGKTVSLEEYDARRSRRSR